MEFFQRIGDYKLEYARITAFGSTRKPGIPAERDSNLKSIIESGVTAAALFGKSWDFHVLRALETTLEENLAMVRESIMLLKEHGLEVIFDAEHFFDGYRNNRGYALSVLQAATDAGADWIVLCDTNGGTMPWEIGSTVQQARQLITTPMGIHMHNDSGCAAAGSLTAVRNGCIQVQGTINGYGERCGNADLCVVIPGLELKLGQRVLPAGNLKKLKGIADCVNGIANMPPCSNQPYTGKGAFTHKAGIHVSALLKNSLTYEHISPEDVGNRRRVLVSELSGISNIICRAGEMNIDISGNDTAAVSAVREIKELENRGYSFEGADASLELLLRRASGKKHSFFTVKEFRVVLNKNDRGEVSAEAMLEVVIDNMVYRTAAEGTGPADAVENSLRRVLTGIYPETEYLRMTGCRVHVLDAADGAASGIRVITGWSDTSDSWNTIGVSGNITEASLLAIADGINYLLIKKRG